MSFVLCTNCKNPIDKSSAICEWCGENLKKKKENELEDNRAARLDKEILNILSKNPTPLELQQALNLYISKTGYNGITAEVYVSKLWGDHFSEEFAQRIRKIKTNTKRVMFFFTLLLFMAISITAIILYKDIKFDSSSRHYVNEAWEFAIVDGVRGYWLYSQEKMITDTLTYSAIYVAIYAILMLVTVIVRIGKRKNILYYTWKRLP